MTERFASANPVETQVKAGDCNGVVDAVRALTPAQRAALAPSLRVLLRALDSARWNSADKAAL